MSVRQTGHLLLKSPVITEFHNRFYLTDELPA